MIAPPTLTRYREQSYVVLKGLVSAEQRRDLVQEIGHIFTLQAARYDVPAALPDDPLHFADMTASLFAADRAAYLAAAKLSQYTLALTRIGVSEEIAAVLRELGVASPVISTRPVMHYISDAVRFEGGYHKTPIHQDWRSIQGSLDGIVVWTPFTPVTVETHPMEVIPGSHRRGLLESRDHVFGHQIDPSLVNEAEFLPLEAEPGDAVFFSTFLIHRTAPGSGRGMRVAATFRYNNVDEPTFVSRRYPNPYIYKPDMRLLHENFPSLEQVHTVFAGNTQQRKPS